MNWLNEFPLLQNCTYVNTPGSGLLAKSLVDWRRQHDLQFFNEGSIFRIDQASFIDGVKQTVADFLKADKYYTFLVPNFSFGFNTFLDGLNSSERILLLGNDYPSIYFPVESRGFAFETIKIDEHLEERIWDAIKTFKPTVLAFSLVQYINGIKIDFDFLKEIKVQYPDILLLADGTQYCGTEAFDFEASGLDFLASSGYKWMLSGYGNGFVLLKEQAAMRFLANLKNSDLPKEPFLRDKGILSLHFEPGHQDTLVYGSLQQAVQSFNHIGLDLLAARIQSIASTAKAAFAERGLLEQAVVERAQHSSIFSLALSKEKFRQLQEAGVVCLQRGPGTRVGFHFYNTEEDLLKILEVLDH